ncbi:MAG: hypothetical protein KF819_33395 [Labilithrix sp.]|nr:hypothetical protein [Labilithrix sp.]
MRELETEATVVRTLVAYQENAARRFSGEEVPRRIQKELTHRRRVAAQPLDGEGRVAAPVTEQAFDGERDAIAGPEVERHGASVAEAFVAHAESLRRERIGARVARRVGVCGDVGSDGRVRRRVVGA